MDHKVSPNGLRYGIKKDWQSRWYVTTNEDLLDEDYLMNFRRS